jgi:aminoglycoside/choline kinase family phosphotransferase
MRHTAHLLLPDFDGTHLLVLSRGDAWALPAVQTGESWLSVAPINAAVWDELALTATTLRCVRPIAYRPGNILETIMEMETHDPVWTPTDGARWIDPGDAGAIAALPPTHRRAVTGWFAARDAEPPAGRAPWARRGWHAEASRRIREQLRALDRPPTAAPEQVRHWSLASIMRVPTTRGDVWCKTVPPMFAHEPAAIDILATVSPEHLPRILARDRGHNMTLMEEIDGDALRHTPSPPLEDALRALAQLQAACVARADDLRAAGCPDRTLDTLPAQLRELLDHPDIAGALPAAERDRLNAFGASLPSRIQSLRECGLPETLLHGDFHWGNVSASTRDTPARITIFDWTDACIGHPFFDLATFFPDDADRRAAITPTYFNVWHAAYPAARVDEAATLAEPLAALHHAVSYRRILDAVPPDARWEVDDGAGEWLRRLCEIAV